LRSVTIAKQSKAKTADLNTDISVTWKPVDWGQSIFFPSDSYRFDLFPKNDGVAVTVDDLPELDELKWLAVDLDGCLAETVFDAGDPSTAHSIGKPIKRNVEKLRRAVAKGYNIAIHTSKPWADYVRIERWCKLNSIPYKIIVCGKLLAHRYVDDRSVNSEEPEWV
jgi:hypothetical protein